MARRKFIVRGVVQRVGYRALVLQVGSNLGIKGSIRNLADGSVEIFADGTEDILQRFKTKIDRKGDPEDFTRMHVSEIKEISEDQFEWPDKKFTGFEIDYGFEPKTEYERATLEDLEIMKMGGGFLRDDMSILSNDMHAFAVNTTKTFGTLFETYGSFSKEMTDIKNTLIGFSKDMGEIKDTLVDLKDVIGDFSKRYFEQNGKKPARNVKERKPGSRQIKRMSKQK